jgi:hypothetical protein
MEVPTSLEGIQAYPSRTLTKHLLTLSATSLLLNRILINRLAHQLVVLPRPASSSSPRFPTVNPKPHHLPPALQDHPAPQVRRNKDPTLPPQVLRAPVVQPQALQLQALLAHQTSARAVQPRAHLVLADRVRPQVLQLQARLALRLLAYQTLAR